MNHTRNTPTLHTPLLLPLRSPTPMGRSIHPHFGHLSSMKTLVRDARNPTLHQHSLTPRILRVAVCTGIRLLASLGRDRRVHPLEPARPVLRTPKVHSLDSLIPYGRISTHAYERPALAFALGTNRGLPCPYSMSCLFNIN
jgi:hypothetical protein